MTIEVSRAPADFCDWKEALKLLRSAFASHVGRVDPPSSVDALDAASLADKAAEEALLLATRSGELLGCVFVRLQQDSVYLSKLAVWPHRQGEGIGRRLLRAAEDLGRECGVSVARLNTRIELIENHRIFAALGYVKTAEHAHKGFDRPTYIAMEKPLVPDRGRASGS